MSSSRKRRKEEQAKNAAPSAFTCSECKKVLYVSDCPDMVCPNCHPKIEVPQEEGGSEDGVSS